MINLVLLNPCPRGRNESGEWGGACRESGQTSPQPTPILSIFLRSFLSPSSSGVDFFFFFYFFFLFIFILLYCNFALSWRQSGPQALLSRDRDFPREAGGESGDSAAAQPGGDPFLIPPRGDFGEHSRGMGRESGPGEGARHPPLRTGGSGEKSL